MSDRKRIFIWTLISIVAGATATIALEKSRPNLGVTSDRKVGSVASPGALSINQNPTSQSRNLSLQPEAFKLRKKLGKRFTDSQRLVSVTSGTLTIGSNAQLVQLTRRQNKRGERIEIALGTDPSRLTWDGAEGAKAANGAANEAQRSLIERLAFDSADQFVLAQLRGASYHTVGRSVRPAEAGGSDSYNGPIWTIVRVSDPDEDNRRRPESKSRLYFINESTGLIDRVVAEAGGEKIEATFSGWTSQDGETFPTRIVWSRNGQTIMEFSLRNFSRASA